jgi:uncharacterized protein YggU (UPF0235/DUF167 family)
MQVISIKVKLHARLAFMEPQRDGTFIAHLTAQPVDGKANEELLALVARHFGVRRADVTLKSGASSRVKRVTVDV